MCQYPEIQELVHKEISNEFGLDGTITIQDKKRLPYLMAVINEVGRHASVTAGFQLKGHAIGDLKLAGYDVETGGVLFVCSFYRRL